MDRRKKTKPIYTGYTETTSVTKVKMDVGADVYCPSFPRPEVNTSQSRNSLRSEDLSSFSNSPTSKKISFFFTSEQEVVYLRRAETDLARLLNITINSFLATRDFLGIQLDKELGNITDEEFAGLKEIYLQKFDSIENNEILDNLKNILTYANYPLNTDQLAALFNCSEEKIALALKNIMNELETKNND